MKSFLLAVVFLVIGALAGGFLALTFGTGLGAGLGLATGFSAGACSVLEAAREQGLLTEDDFTPVIEDAVARIAGQVEAPLGEQAPMTAADCRKVLADLAKASSDS